MYLHSARPISDLLLRLNEVSLLPSPRVLPLDLCSRVLGPRLFLFPLCFPFVDFSRSRTLVIVGDDGLTEEAIESSADALGG